MINWPIGVGPGVTGTGVCVVDPPGVDVGLAVGAGEGVGDGCCAAAAGPLMPDDCNALRQVATSMTETTCDKIRAITTLL